MNSHKSVMVVFVTLLFLAALAEPHYASGEISLFDSEGNAKAYIADDLTIYLWEGDPVAYLFGSSGSVHVYDFDGNHLGWFENGIVRDHDGKAVGAMKGAVSMITSIEPIKGIKSIKPIKGIREIAPMKPLFSNYWSATPLSVFFRIGSLPSRPMDSLPSMSQRSGSPDVIESYIEDDFEGWSGDTIFKLDNGQIWQQASYAYHYHYAYHPKVTIVKTSGGYKMFVEDVDETIYVRRLR